MSRSLFVCLCLVDGTTARSAALWCIEIHVTSCTSKVCPSVCMSNSGTYHLITRQEDHLIKQIIERKTELTTSRKNVFFKFFKTKGTFFFYKHLFQNEVTSLPRGVHLWCDKIHWSCLARKSLTSTGGLILQPHDSRSRRKSTALRVFPNVCFSILDQSGELFSSYSKPS